MSGSETGSEDHHQGGPSHGQHSSQHHGGGDGGGFCRPNEGNVATRAICIENKRFYMDVKENSRGRFIKISELSLEGRRNHIVMTMPIAAMFQKVLRNMIAEYSYLEPLNAERRTVGDISSEGIHSDEKKYRVDLKENVRGRFLKVSETFVQGKSHFQIAIPADGMVEFDEHLSDLIEEHGELESGAGASGDLPESSPPSASGGGGSGGGASTNSQGHHNSSNSNWRKLQIDNKTYTLDCRKHGGGRVITVCESRNNFRRTIEIPESGWDAFRELFNEFTNECQEATPAL
eukprot:TRINITY_DN167_c0_g1_i5.p1 TRINITY_DN167_c0_g1~~TRINITY_DN167_c0_g1_i5.p1  ORF type:complete len:330 (-),score=89.64 TRINITY_DN167_c0_g1_i5:400-1269(-)